MSLLINRVLEQVKADLSMGDLTAIEELLTFVPKENLIGYLPEEEWEQYENDYQCQNCGSWARSVKSEKIVKDSLVTI